MWIEELPSGKYKAFERYTDPLSGKRKRVSITMDSNSRKAQKSAQHILSEKILAKISSTGVAKVTLRALCNKYQTQYTTIRESTQRRNGFFADSACRLLGDDTLVDNLTAGYIKEKIAESGMSIGSTNEFLTRFKAFIRWGYDNDYVKDISYLSKLKPIKDDAKKEKIQDKYLEPEELKALIGALSIQRWKDLTTFLALTGLRIGEAIALCIDDVDIDQREIHVTKTWDITNDTLHDTSKTPAGVRDVYIQDELLPLCVELRRIALIEKMCTGCSLFFQYNGRRYCYGSYSQALKGASKGRTAKHITPHILRHTHVSLLAAEGITLEEVSRRVGHENSAITRKVYFHVTKKLKKRDQDRIREVKIL